LTDDEIDDVSSIICAVTTKAAEDLLLLQNADTKMPYVATNDMPNVRNLSSGHLLRVQNVTQLDNKLIGVCKSTRNKRAGTTKDSLEQIVNVADVAVDNSETLDLKPKQKCFQKTKHSQLEKIQKE